ncbi:MAG: hypothetical protein WAU88_12655 [Candidatus Zixiibacteriota bacterium]
MANITRIGLGTLSVVLLLSLASTAEPTPSQQAIKEGYKEVKAFSDAFKPLISKSLPAKDYGTLLTSGKDVVKAAFAFSHFSYSSHLHVKDSIFRANRDSLSLTAQAYGAAAERFDTTAVCKLLPTMDQFFESAVAATLPVRWLDFEKLHASAETLYARIVSADAPKSKFDTAKVIANITAEMAAFATSTIPTECTIAPDLVDSERTYYTKVVEKMNAAWLSKDMVALKKTTTDLKVRLLNFRLIYLT